jgi:DNA-binding NarL/FixJ family response regulator
MPPIRVILADDHTLVRAGLRALLQNIAGVEVVGEAADGREALALIKARQPDIVLMDISMAGLNGLEATARTVRDFPKVRVLILSAHANEEYVCQSLRCGASGYLLKDGDPAELELALKAVARGEAYLSPRVSRHVVATYIQRVGGEAGPLEMLTARQREILQLIAEGHTTRAIAAKLHISGKTVETHRAQLMDRLDIHEVAGLVRYALRVGLVKSDD